MRFYKAIKGTALFDKYGDRLIHQGNVPFIINIEHCREIIDATPEDLLKVYNQQPGFDLEMFQTLAEMAEINLKQETRIDSVIEKIEKTLDIQIS